MDIRILDEARAKSLITDSTSAFFGQWVYFPRRSSYQPGVDSVHRELEDAAHSYLSPHIQVAFPVTQRTNFRLSYAHQVQQPDFGTMLTGINTDLSITNTNHVYGADLDFGTVWVNCHQILPAETPHGGFKRSGMGKDLSVFGVEDYTRIKSITTAVPEA